MKLVFAEILHELKVSGYRVSARLLNAMYFGVPQSRERMIFIGVRDDLGIGPSHPAAETEPITPRDSLLGCVEQDRRFLSDWLRDAATTIDAGNYSHKSVEKSFIRAKGKRSGSINTKMLSWDRVSCTIVKSEIAETGMIHPDGERYLDTSEIKRIGSFPENFVFIGNRKDKIERIGNSVPPLFMRSIAYHIRTEILDKIE